MIKQFIRRVVARLPRFGKSSRQTGKHLPEVFHRQQHGIDPKRVSKHATRVCETLQQAGFRAFIVGGAVRDLLLGLTPKDFDIATDAEPEQVQKLFRRARIIGRRFRLVHVMMGSETMEVSTFRAAQSDDSLTDEHGRVLRDNVFGNQDEDAARRDFTINALYFDPSSQTVLDYHRGVHDLRARTLRMIGDPATRYREDPVRMLRVVRFAAKLDINIDPATQAPIAELKSLLTNVPQARLFDELLKLLMSGCALGCLERLQTEGLHTGIFPLLDHILPPDDQTGAGDQRKFVHEALRRTDQRLREGKPVSSSFLLATLLWGLVRKHWTQRCEAGELRIPALYAAMDDVLEAQDVAVGIPRKIASDMRDIWALQPRFEKRQGKAVFRMLDHLRLRAGLDFLELRADSGEIDLALAQWWRAFAEQPDERTALLENLTASKDNESAPRKRRRRKPSGKPSTMSDSTGTASTQPPHDNG